jgi:hypothetical protein
MRLRPQPPAPPSVVTVLAAAALVAVVALAGCLGGPAPGASAASCGIEEPEMGANLDVDGRRCLLDAFLAGRPAVFETRMTSIEGDPIARRYTVLGPALVQIEHDARQDRYGSGKVEVLHCPRLVPVAEWNEANGETMNPDEVFIEDGCELVEER